MSESPNFVCFDEAEYAGPGRRFASFIIDLIVILFLYGLIGIAISISVVPAEIRSAPPSPEKQQQISKALRPHQPLLLGLITAATIGYHVLLRARAGRTIGNMVTGTRLVDETGATPEFRRVMRRFIVAVPACLPLGAAYRLTFKDARRQAVHDRWAGTWVVRKGAETRPAVTEYHHRMFGPWLLHYTSLAEVPESTAAAPAGATTTDMPPA